MCDTAGKLLEWGGLFAKNSDRRVNEPQVCEYYAPAVHTDAYTDATYIRIEQVRETYGHLLSRPVWLWGGEMGVNELGVAIGNEAVFTKGRYGKSGLTGMDLLRLGLERGATAKEAVDVIVEALERYGQGGNCSYDGRMYYDNSFIVMDKDELYVLETHNKLWAYKKMDAAAISNELTLRADGDVYHDGNSCDFKKKYSNPVKSAFVFAESRRGVMLDAVGTAESPADMMQALSTHKPKRVNPMKNMTAFGPCMHAGPLNGDATTASMVAELRESPRIWLTGCSAPCISLYKPWAFGNPAVLPVQEAGLTNPEEYWLNREAFHRLAIGKKLPRDFYAQRKELQNKWLRLAEALDNEHLYELSEQAYRDEEEFYGRWRGALCTPRKGTKAYLKFWRAADARLNAAVRAGENEYEAVF